ncbi:uncharacterized protein LOC107435791 isoform X5 [Ziziphus jujuba]|uniref:Uncharacterized protein LOC107435791 isoform X5 n=1 Tax=Ziziphus jujuba TaxID=326968 RepID=A0ABM3I054_ZIZJJ|nr:uncharacterized protein LOC107435791 isoform X5 [Ziziphus jujuba]
MRAQRDIETRNEECWSLLPFCRYIGRPRKCWMLQCLDVCLLQKVGGLRSLFGCKPLLLSMGKSTVYCGVAGNGSVLNHGKAKELNLVASAAKGVGLKCPVTFHRQTM